MTTPTTPARRRAAALIVAAALAAAPARADVKTDMRTFWDGLGGGANVTGPSAFDGQAAGYYTLGNLYSRAPTRRSQIAALELPGFRAGCGGIDLFAGAFSFINADELVAAMKAIAANATGFAFQLALDTISPMISDVLGELRDLAQRINDLDVNSCETAQALVGGLWPASDRASETVCAAVGNSQGMFADYAAAKHGCGAEGKRAATLKSAGGDLADQVPVDVNYAWAATRKSPLLRGDRDLAEMFMSLSGSIVVTAPLDDDAPSQRRILEPLIDDGDAVAALLNGGDIPVYRCDEPDKCLNPTRTTRALAAADGFKAKVETLMVNMVTALENDTPPGKAEKALVNMTALPVYRLLADYSLYEGVLARNEAHTIAEAVALDVLHLYLKESQKDMARAAGRLRFAGPDLEKWRATLRDNRAAVSRMEARARTRFDTAMDIVQKARAVESQIAESLSRTMLDALSYDNHPGAAPR